MWNVLKMLFLLCLVSWVMCRIIFVLFFYNLLIEKKKFGIKFYWYIYGEFYL